MNILINKAEKIEKVHCGKNMAALLQMLAKGFKPKLIFDDRAKVVKMWRGRGLRCRRVAEGDFSLKK